VRGKMRKSSVLYLAALIWVVFLVHSSESQENLPLERDTSVLKDEYFVGLDHSIEIQIQVWGEVNKPGLYRLREGCDILEAISVAGGPQEEANLKQIQVFRENGKAEKVDLEKIIHGESPRSLLRLGPGDMVWIPRKTRHSWRNIMDLVRDLAILANIYYLISHGQ